VNRTLGDDLSAPLTPPRLLEYAQSFTRNLALQAALGHDNYFYHGRLNEKNITLSGGLTEFGSSRYIEAPHSPQQHRRRDEYLRPQLTEMKVKIDLLLGVLGWIEPDEVDPVWRQRVHRRGPLNALWMEFPFRKSGTYGALFEKYPLQYFYDLFDQEVERHLQSVFLLRLGLDPSQIDALSDLVKAEFYQGTQGLYKVQRGSFGQAVFDPHRTLSLTLDTLAKVSDLSLVEKALFKKDGVVSPLDYHFHEHRERFLRAATLVYMELNPTPQTLQEMVGRAQAFYQPDAWSNFKSEFQTLQSSETRSFFSRVFTTASSTTFVELSQEAERVVKNALTAPGYSVEGETPSLGQWLRPRLSGSGSFRESGGNTAQCSALF
jgi:hypothetical protein